MERVDARLARLSGYALRDDRNANNAVFSQLDVRDGALGFCRSGAVLSVATQ